MWKTLSINKLNHALLKQKGLLKTVKPQRLTSNQLKLIQYSQFTILQSRFSSSIPKSPTNTTPEVAKTGIEESASTTQGILESEPLIKLLDPSNYSSLADPFIYFSEFFIDFIRIATGMPWAPTIIVFALIVRMLSIPSLRKRYELFWLRAYVKYLMHQDPNLKPHEFARENVRLIRDLKVTPFHIMRNYAATASICGAGLASVFFISKDLSFPIIHNTLKESSFIWIDNLSIMDPYMILPGISIVSTFLNMGQLRNVRTNIALLGMCGALFYLTYGFPAIFHLFWGVLNISSIIIKPYIRAISKVKAKVVVNNFEKKHASYFQKLKEINESKIKEK